MGEYIKYFRANPVEFFFLVFIEIKQCNDGMDDTDF